MRGSDGATLGSNNPLRGSDSGMLGSDNPLRGSDTPMPRCNDSVRRSSPRRKALAVCLALTLGGVLLASAPAGAGASTVANLSPSFSPDRLGAPAALTLAIRYRSSQGGVPAPVTHTLVDLPAGVSFDLGGVSVCSRARAARGSCPASSRVGSGSTLSEAHLGSLTLTENATLTAFRGPNQGVRPTMEIASQGLTPLIERVVITGVVEADAPPYGPALALSVPPIPTLPTEPNASIVRFSLTIGAARGGLVRVPHTCPADGFPFASSFTFADASTAQTTATARCP
jgi:hypothetical protein